MYSAYKFLYKNVDGTNYTDNQRIISINYFELRYMWGIII